MKRSQWSKNKIDLTTKKCSKFYRVQTYFQPVCRKSKNKSVIKGCWRVEYVNYFCDL